MELFFSKTSFIERIIENDIKSHSLERELINFSHNRFFDFFGLKIQYVHVKHFLCVFIKKIESEIIIDF